jgi:uncharacterized protein YdhG (YjbR/CyaY superfamily)
MSVSSYTAHYDGEVKNRLKTLRRLIKDIVPDAVETISYQIPTYKYQGKNLVHFAAFEHHIGLYPSPRVIEHFLPELAAYRTSKGTIQFPHTSPFPQDLIQSIIQ